MPQPHMKSESDLNQELKSAAAEAVETLANYLTETRAGHGRASGYAPLTEVIQQLNIDGWIARGGMNRATFGEFLSTYLSYSVQLHHPAYIAHQVSTPQLTGALDGLINGVLSNPMAIYEMGPAGAAIEFSIINWMLTKVGWPPQPLHSGGIQGAAGVLTHGGSLANLTALLAARAHAAPDAWEQGTPSDLAVLVAPGAHYSVARAVSILGLGSRAVYPLDADRWGVVDPDGLERSLDRVNQDGRKVMAVVANACATATGLHDPLRPIGQFCAEHRLWLHADACHGASALISDKYRELLDGIELADSIVWDAHKMLQVPVVCAAVLLRDGADFGRAFHQKASYLAYGLSEERYDSLPRAVECTKASLGLRVFLNLAWYGEAALSEHIDSRYDMAQRFHDLINQRDGFECPIAPDTNIVCFRYGTDNAFQASVRDQLMREGQFHITSAEIAGDHYLRLTVSNPGTDENTLAALLDAIEWAATGAP